MLVYFEDVSVEGILGGGVFHLLHIDGAKGLVNIHTGLATGKPFGEWLCGQLPLCGMAGYQGSDGTCLIQSMDPLSEFETVI